MPEARSSRDHQALEPVPARAASERRKSWALPPGLLNESQAAIRLRRSIVLLLSVVVFGTIGYMLIEGWNVWDA